MPPSAPNPSTSWLPTPNPTAIGAMMGIGAIGGAIGSYFSAQSNKIQLGLQADLARINARISETAAKSALLAGEREVQAVKLRTGQMKAKQRVNFAASGVDLSSGSVQDVFNTTDFMGEIDANTVEANAIRAAWGYRTQGAGYTSQAIMSQANASSISATGSAFNSLLGSAAYAAPTYYQMIKAGV